MHACAHSGYHHLPRLPLSSKLNWHTPHTPPGLMPPPPHLPQSTLSRFFHSKPCQTGMHSKISFFLCTGPAPTPPTPPAHYAITWGDYLHTFSTPSMHLLHTLVLLFTLHFLGLSPIPDFHLTSDPFGYPGQPSPSAIWAQHPPQTSVDSSPNPAASIPPTYSLWACTTHSAIQGPCLAWSTLPKQHPLSLW